MPRLDGKPCARYPLGLTHSLNCQADDISIVYVHGTLLQVTNWAFTYPTWMGLNHGHLPGPVGLPLHSLTFWPNIDVVML